MSWTTAERTRVAALEVILNQVQVAVTNLAAKQQVRQLTLLKQSEINQLRERIEDLERIVLLLEGAIL